MTLLEKYAPKLRVCESLYRNARNEKMPEYKKVMVARVLENTKNFLNESIATSAATQVGGSTATSNLGTFKKFCLNLTTVALPNLIGTDLVITSPMSSMTGYVTYLEYTAGTNKGGVQVGDVFNSVFRQGDMTEDRMNYTGQAVVEAVTSFTSGTTAVAFAPVIAGSIRLLDANGVQVDDATQPATADADGKVTQTHFVSGKSATDVKKIAYKYDNAIVPQKSDLATLKAELKSIPLTAKVRRIAVYFSQIAAFQAKTDYGFDLQDQIAEQAISELNYEIDSEIVGMLVKGAENLTELEWSKTLPVGVSKAQHYEGFVEMIEKARAIVYKRTKKFSPNYMIVAPDIIPVLTFISGWKAADIELPNGPYMAGTLNGLRVYVSPMMEDGHWVCGVNGNDMQTSAGVFAPYMAVVPTQLLGFADGMNTQGFSSLYDLKLLSTYNRVGTAMVSDPEGQFSYMLVQGKVVA